MNIHVLVMIAEFFAICGIAMLTLLYFALPARAHSSVRRPSLLPSPVFAIAKRLAREGRFREAIRAYDAVRESASYRNTEDAPEAVYETAHLYRDALHDPEHAMARYETLLFEYPTRAYPHKPLVRTERATLARVLDHRNSGKFLYRFVAFFVRLVGSGTWSYPCALFLISLMTRVLLLPLTIRQQKEALRMQRLKPQVEALQAEHQGNSAAMNEHVMALYKREGIHPLLGTGLALMQGAVFLVLYQAILLYKYHFIGGTFLWIHGSTALAYPGIAAYDLSEPDLLLLLCYGGLMFASQRLMVPAQQAANKTSMLLSSAVTTAFFIAWTWANHSPSAFVLYWLISSLLATVAQLAVQKMPRLQTA